MVNFKKGDKVRFKRREEIGEALISYYNLKVELFDYYEGDTGVIEEEGVTDANIMSKIRMSDGTDIYGHDRELHLVLERVELIPEEYFQL